MKIYIAGPMTGYPEFNYPAFDAAAVLLRKQGYTALNPAVHKIDGTIMPWDYYVRAGLKMLMDAEGVALLPGWDESKGAGIEVWVARSLGMEVKPLPEWMT